MNSGKLLTISLLSMGAYLLYKSGSAEKKPYIVFISAYALKRGKGGGWDVSLF